MDGQDKQDTGKKEGIRGRTGKTKALFLLSENPSPSCPS